MMVSDGKYFKHVVKGANFMTPKLNGYFLSGDYECELTHGRGIDGELIYGVTVVNAETMKHEHGLSKMFHRRKDALNYIKAIGA